MDPKQAASRMGGALSLLSNDVLVVGFVSGRANGTPADLQEPVLSDEDGNRYEPYYRGSVGETFSAGTIKLTPLALVYGVPKGSNYYLTISAGTGSAAKAVIDLQRQAPIGTPTGSAIPLLLKSADNQPKDSRPEIKSFFSSVSVGNWAYTIQSVHDHQWLNTAFGERLFAPEGSMFLTVRLTIANVGRAADGIDLPVLVDSAGRVYESSYQPGVPDQFVGPENVNPGMAATGHIVFPVPRNRSYRLLVSGGALTDEAAVSDYLHIGTYSGRY